MTESPPPHSPPGPAPLVGLFVGGRSRRMGGRPKGLLVAPDGDGPLVVRSARLVAGLGWPLVLVGEASPYAEALPGARALDDEPGGVGPLGGLAALLAAAGGRPAIALACDMPRVAAADLAALAAFDPGAAIVAGRRDEGAPWEPLFARYDPARVLPLAREAIGRGELSLQRLLVRAGARRVPLASADALDDWDSPDDVDTPPRGERVAGDVDAPPRDAGDVGAPPRGGR